MDEILMKLAKKIETKCGAGLCPCSEDCCVYTDEECMDRIINWLKTVLEEE